jgi:hypothetical protein
MQRDAQKIPPLQTWVFLQIILLVVFFRSNLLVLENFCPFCEKSEVAISHAGTPSLQLEPACGWLVSPDCVP